MALSALLGSGYAQRCKAKEQLGKSTLWQSKVGETAHGQGLEQTSDAKALRSMAAFGHGLAQMRIGNA